MLVDFADQYWVLLDSEFVSFLEQVWVVDLFLMRIEVILLSLIIVRVFSSHIGLFLSLFPATPCLPNLTPLTSLLLASLEVLFIGWSIHFQLASFCQTQPFFSKNNQFRDLKGLDLRLIIS